MKLSRLWRPRRPLFWLMVLSNLLSFTCGWATRHSGPWCAWRLVQLPD